MPDPPPLALPSDCAINEAEVKQLAPKWTSILSDHGEDRLHVLGFDRSDQRASQTHMTHIWNGQIPEGSFYVDREGTFIESPPFMFLQAASILSFEKLIAFGDELCGLYSFDENEERGFRKRKEPLTTIARLEQYLQMASGRPGSKNARRALQHLVELSASPMETYDEMTMALPYMYGGYCMNKPTMNQEVTLSSRASRIAHRKKCFLDLGYLENSLDIEHHGKHDHSSNEEKESDRERVAGLREMGIEVIELTWKEVADLQAYEFIIERIAKILGKRIDKSKLGPTPERLRLRNELAAWNSSAGKIR